MERIGTLVVAPTTERKAEPGRFSEALRSAATETVHGIAGTLSLAAPYLPGGAVLAGALRTTVPAAPVLGPTPGAAPSTGTARPLTVAAAPVTPGAPAPPSLASSALASAVGSAAAPAAGTGNGGDLMEATRVLQQQSQSFNLQYLQLQESMQRESREFTAVTNVMKVRHESAKTAIGNIH